MADGGDRPDVWVELKRKARKPHKCSECGRAIETGETYRFSKHLYDGVWWDNKQCSHCIVLADWLAVECGGYLCEGVLEDFLEHAREYRRFDLWRAYWGAPWQWRRDGHLLPIPKMPLTSEQRAAA
jgi:hypothetical protein